VSDAVDKFIAELRADPAYAASADEIRDCIIALDREADISPDAAGFYEALYWVVGRQDRTLDERMEKCHELVTRRGRVEGTIREIVGW
jgi:hypothetical protein